MSREFLREIKKIPGSDLRHNFDTYLKFISCSVKLYKNLDEVDEYDSHKPVREYRLIADVELSFETFGFRPDTSRAATLGFCLVPAKVEHGKIVPIRYILPLYGDFSLKCRGVQSVSVEVSQRSGETIDHSSEVRSLYHSWMPGHDRMTWRPC